MHSLLHFEDDVIIKSPDYANVMLAQPPDMTDAECPPPPGFAYVMPALLLDFKHDVIPLPPGFKDDIICPPPDFVDDIIALLSGFEGDVALPRLCGSCHHSASESCKSIMLPLELLLEVIQYHTHTGDH